MRSYAASLEAGQGHDVQNLIIAPVLGASFHDRVWCLTGAAWALPLEALPAWCTRRCNRRLSQVARNTLLHSSDLADPHLSKRSRSCAPRQGTMLVGVTAFGRLSEEPRATLACPILARWVWRSYSFPRSSSPTPGTQDGPELWRP